MMNFNLLIENWARQIEEERNTLLKNDITKELYKYPLPENLFKYNKDKTTLTIKLYSNVEEFKEFEFMFYVYKSDNHVYIQIDYFFGTVFELILQIKGVKISQTKQWYLLN